MIVSHTSASTVVVGSSCPSSPMLLTTTSPVIGQTASINLTSGPPSSTGILLFSALPASPPSAIQPSGCLLYVNQSGLGIFTFFSTNGAGSWSLSGTIPNDPNLECSKATFQALIVAAVPGGLAFTNGVDIAFGF